MIFSKASNIAFNPPQRPQKLNKSFDIQNKMSVNMSFGAIRPEQKLVNLAHKLDDGRASRSILKELKKVALEIKLIKIDIKTKTKVKKLKEPVRYFKGMRFASILLIQKAFRQHRIKRNLKSKSFPSLKMLVKSPYLRFKNCVKAYMNGWKTRKIINSENIENYKRHIQELTDFYASESGNNKYVLKAKSDYIEAINRAIKNPNWYKDLVNSKDLEEKRLRVQRMREKNQRLRENKINLSSNMGKTDYDQKYQTTKNVNNSMSLAFDFTSAATKAKKTYEEIEEENRNKKIEENRQKKKSNFLKRRANMKYDPNQAIKEDKILKEKLMLYSDLMSENYINEEAVVVDEQVPQISATALKLGDLIEREKQRKMRNQKLSVKGIMGSPKAVIDKAKVNISESFQKLDYLKKVPKKIDCWLSKENKSISSDIKHRGYPKMRNSTQDLQKDLVVQNSMNNFEDFSEFSKNAGLVKAKPRNVPTTTKNGYSISRDFNHLSRLNESGISIESAGMTSDNKSNVFHRFGLESGSPKHTGSKILRESLFSNEGECLEFLIDRLENGSNQGIMSSNDKLVLKEDKSMYSRLKKSKPLLEIFKLMNTVEKANNNIKDDKAKLN